jgi:hypothetical protein
MSPIVTTQLPYCVEWEEYVYGLCAISLYSVLREKCLENPIEIYTGCVDLKTVRTVRAKNWSNIGVTHIESNTSQLDAVLRSQGSVCVTAICCYVSPEERHAEFCVLNKRRKTCPMKPIAPITNQLQDLIISFFPIYLVSFCKKNVLLI